MVLTFKEGKSKTRLSANFVAGEFACKCGQCKSILVDSELVNRLQQIRDHFGVPVNVNSGYRCKSHNAAVGGDPQSSHMKGMAADICLPGVKPAEVAKYAESIGIRRIGKYDNFVHIGSGQTKRFWIGNEGKEVETFGAEQSFTVELPVLRRGSRGDAVKAVQRHLRGWGAAIEADSSYGPATEAAVKKYQAEHGLPAHGVTDKATRQMMLGIEG